MKCPKCGYLGFETTDRCRNCQYDFSLSPTRAESELALNDRTAGPEPDFDMPAISRSTETPSTALDLDRLFGEREPAAQGVPAIEPVLPASSSRGGGARASKHTPDLDDYQQADEAEMAGDSEEPDEDGASAILQPAAARDEESLPFDDVPIVPPPAARIPLAVRRSTPEVPRNRPRTSRIPRTDSLDLGPPSDAPKGQSAVDVTETIASLLQTPSLAARIGAGVIDALLIAVLNGAVIYLTLRVTGLQNSLADVRLLPPVPFVGFLAAIAFGYVAAFTVGGGQTIGKMMLNLRVIGDDGRPVDAAGGMLRAVGCMLVPATFGLSYLPAIFTSDHRAVHDRIAGTRVVQE
jgi:uncharacterized RDD family membrane protein YckC